MFCIVFVFCAPCVPRSCLLQGVGSCVANTLLFLSFSISSFTLHFVCCSVLSDCCLACFFVHLPCVNCSWLVAFMSCPLFSACSVPLIEVEKVWRPSFQKVFEESCSCRKFWILLLHFLTSKQFCGSVKEMIEVLLKN